MNKDDATEIKQRVYIPMSDADLEKYTGVKPVEILKYSDLKNYATMRELLPNDQDFKIILIEQRSNNGHWVTVMRYGTTCEYFNSYGKPADTDWIFVNRMMRVILGENTNEMTRLLKQAEEDGFHTIYNHTAFQKFSKTVNTCGRWVVMRVEMMRMGYSLPEFSAFIKDQSKRLKRSYDFVVAKFIKE